jgi:hypothetical protein
MDKLLLLKEVYERNLIRKLAQLPLLDVREEFDHACAVAALAEWQEFCATKTADRQRIRTEVTAELRAKHNAHFPNNSIDAIAVDREVERRFEAFVAIHYGVTRPHDAPRHAVTYGGSPSSQAAP